MKKQEIQDFLKDLFKKKLVIVGIGNILKGDDGFGPCLIERLNGKVKAKCIDAGTSPENQTGAIKKEKPEAILIVDAAYLGSEPGEYKVLKKADIVKSGFTTHDLSPGMFIEYMESQTKADVYMLGVEPKGISFGSEMSANVKKALDEIEALIKEADNA